MSQKYISLPPPTPPRTKAAQGRRPGSRGKGGQLFLFGKPDTSTNTLTGCRPAPEGDRRWLAAFVGDAWPLIREVPAIKHRRKSA
jgi:hypothetical protein